MWPHLYDMRYHLSISYAIVFKHNRSFNYLPPFQDQQLAHPLFNVAQYGDTSIGRELNLNITLRSAVRVETTAFRTCATDRDKDRVSYINKCALNQWFATSFADCCHRLNNLRTKSHLVFFLHGFILALQKYMRPLQNRTHSLCQFCRISFRWNQHECTTEGDL